MRAVTWQEIEVKIRTDLDLLDTDNFIGQDEMAALGNDAIDGAESLIMRTREDYFLTKATLTLVNGASSIDLPTDIYAQKIRAIIYKNGDRIYPVERIRDPEIFYKKAIIDYTAVSLDQYQWLLQSTTAGEQDKLLLSPPAYEDGAYLEMWYIRNANRIPLQADSGSPSRATQLATKIDIPEWRSYIEQYIRMRVYEKMKESDLFKDATTKLMAIGEAMIITLKDRVEDNRNEVAQDVSHYMEHN